MQFNSIEFLLFFPGVCLIYYLLPTIKLRNWFLLITSYYFYMNWQPIYALLLLTSTLITYIAARQIEKVPSAKPKKIYLTISVSLNILILFFFKYYGFVAENIGLLMNWIGISMEIPDFGILLPVGISFYTFQALGYSIDVYRGDIKAERNFFNYALFVSFFPQLVAGPIERSTNLLPQFYKKHTFDYDRVIDGLKIMAWGYFMKMVLADRCAIYVDGVYNNMDSHPGMSVLIATILFCFQLYGDFAGYTYIAIGAAKVMGFKLMDNFRRPYLFSTSIQEYWKRNHISLTTWFMDYVYYPLTERSNSINWWCFAIFSTFLISGFWHGAAWTFVIWGAIHGLILVVEIRTQKRRKRFEKRHGLAKREWYLWTTRLCTFMIAALTLVFFRANNVGEAFTALHLIFSPSDFAMTGELRTLMFFFIAFIILFAKELTEEYAIPIPYFKRHRLAANTVWLSFLLLCIAWFGVFGGGEFIYFQF